MMGNSKSKNIYYLFGIIICIASLYSAFIYVWNNNIFFTNTTLFVPFLEAIPLPFSAWIVHNPFMIFPDIMIFALINFFTHETMMAMTCYILLMGTLVCCSLFMVIGKCSDAISSISSYIVIWAMLLLFMFSNNSLFSFFFVPNAYVGFTIVYFIIIRMFYSLVVSKEPEIFFILISILLCLISYSAPMITTIYLGVPLLVLGYMHRRMGRYIPKIGISFELLVILSIVLGFLVQYYCFPLKTSASISSFRTVIYYLFATNPILTIIGFLGGMYCIVEGFIHSLDSMRTYLNRLCAIGMLLGLFASLYEMIDPQFYIIFFMFSGICYGFPLLISALISLLSVEVTRLAHTILVCTVVFTIFLLYWNIVPESGVIYTQSIVSNIDDYVQNKDDTTYVLAPMSLAGTITALSRKGVIAVPYNPSTLEFSSFMPTFSKEVRYSLLVVDTKEKSRAIEQLQEIIGKPTQKELVKDVAILEYSTGFAMPEEGILATYTTAIGYGIRNNLSTAIHIPLPKDFLIKGSAYTFAKILEIDGKTLFLLGFPKDITLEKNTIYKVYTLSSTSSSMRKLFSGIRRELPLLGSFLPLEDESITEINAKNVYILPSGEQVIAIDITKNVKQNITFLSVSTDTSAPYIFVEYPMLPITLES